VSAAYVSRPDYAREIRNALTDVAHVCERLGFLTGLRSFTRQAGGLIIRCPWHADRNPSCSVRRGPDGTIAVRCHACGATGDVLSLVAAANSLTTRRDFRQVLRLAAELGGLWSLVHELDGGTPAPERPKPVAPPPEPERAYPPNEEVSTLWAASDPADGDEQSVAWFQSRGLDATVAASDDLARVIPTETRLPRWASFQRSPWTATASRPP
jgi:hypothetical protein